MNKPSETYDPEVDAIAIRFAPEGARYFERFSPPRTDCGL